MKNILFLLLIFFVKLNAYEYTYYNNGNLETFYTDDTGHLKIYYSYVNSNLNKYTDVQYNGLGDIKYQRHDYYITNDVFMGYLRNDLIFLNDFYTQATNQILNYFYNNRSFGNNDYIVYNDYELLYNSDGLAVESIVDGVWAGLYDDNQKNKSGYLVNQDGVLYKDGEQANYFQELTFYLVHPIQSKFLEADHFATGKACLLFLVTVFTFMMYAWIVNHVVRGLKYYKEIKDRK